MILSMSSNRGKFVGIQTPNSPSPDNNCLWLILVCMKVTFVLKSNVSHFVRVIKHQSYSIIPKAFFTHGDDCDLTRWRVKSHENHFKATTKNKGPSIQTDALISFTCSHRNPTNTQSSQQELFAPLNDLDFERGGWEEWQKIGVVLCIKSTHWTQVFIGLLAPPKAKVLITLK